jgi:formyltetrahydrofolate deformylase
MLVDADVKPRIIIMVSKFDHCLQQLLYDIKLGWLKAEVVSIVSNHEDQRATAEVFGIPYRLWPVNKENRAAQKKLYDLYIESKADLVVLESYMRILSNDLASKLHGHVINRRRSPPGCAPVRQH